MLRKLCRFLPSPLTGAAGLVILSMVLGLAALGVANLNIGDESPVLEWLASKAEYSFFVSGVTIFVVVALWDLKNRFS